MAKTKAKSRAIAVLGMHRSGTSAITRVVNLLGAYLGEDSELMVASADNPAGYWEYQKFYLLQERMLEALGRAWDTALPLHAEWYRSELVAPFRQELLELIQSGFAGRPVWAWKDPRSSILLPLWKDVLAELEIELQCILIYRNPLDVARSLQKRDGFSLADGFGLWLNHNVGMLQNSTGLPRTLVSYERFLANPEAGTSRLAHALSLNFSSADSAARDAIFESVRPDLRHNASTKKDLIQAGCPKPVVDLLQMLDAMEKSGDTEDPAKLPKLERLFLNHASLASLYAHDFKRTEGEKRDLEAQLNERQSAAASDPSAAIAQAQQLSDLQSELAASQQALAEARERQQAVELQFRNREREVTGAQRRVTDYVRELAETRAERETIETRLKLREREANDAEQRHADHVRQLTEARLQRETVESLLELREQEVTKAQELLADNARTLAEARVQRQTVERSLQLRDLELGTLKDLLQDFEAQLAEARASVEERGRDLLNARKEASKQFAALEAARDEVDIELADARSRLSEAEMLIEKRDRELADYRSKLADTESLIGQRDCELEKTENMRAELWEVLQAERRVFETKLSGLQAGRAEARTAAEKFEHEANDTERLRAELWEVLQAERVQAKAQIKRLHATWSWRITRPLRAVVDTSKAIGRKLRRLGGRRSSRTDLAENIPRPMKSAAAAPRISNPQSDGEPASGGADAVDPNASPKVIAFYLPQFYPIPENDQWWGQGFTEWTNVSRAKALFDGHQQPRRPADIGYYDLRLPEVREAQAELARAHGIHGFCYHYYWFDDKRLLERPLNEVLESGRPDFPFCISWANEPWSRRWDGSEKDILIAQEYNDGFAERFARDAVPYLEDSRYIRVGGRPLLIVYRVDQLPDPEQVVETWRREFRDRGIGEVFLGAVEGFGMRDPTRFGFDAAIEFPPHNPPLDMHRVINQLRGGQVQNLDPDFEGALRDYRDCVKSRIAMKPTDYPLFRGVMPGWDNTARARQRARIFHHASPDAYQEWLTAVLQSAETFSAPHEPIVFVNAWNEWAEGAYLEPDAEYGSAYLEATRAALASVRSRDVGSRAFARAALQHDDTLQAGTDGGESFELARTQAESTKYVPAVAAAPPASLPVRLLAFYLPQFHPIPENDEWWGKGFTEWTNVRPAQPQFSGHCQPRVPGELGYYDLRDIEVQKRQVELAKLYGVGGFCFYFYWFGGKRLLETPLQQYLDNAELDLPFCLCWANENWSRTWDGLDNDILISQKHSKADDLAFIEYVSRYFADSRYIRVNGKPLLMIYRPNLFPDARKTANRWRQWCRDNGVGEIYLAYTQSFEVLDPAVYGFDAAIEFPPNNTAPDLVTDKLETLNENFSGYVYDWTSIASRSRNYSKPDYPLFRTVNPSWDNTARRGDGSAIFLGSSPDAYREWLENAAQDTVDRFASPSERLTFVNAWNEWAEGAYLEPDRDYGYAYLEATRDALEHVARKNLSDKIVLVIHDALPHGAQYLTLNLARTLSADLQFDVSLVVLGDGMLLEPFAEWATVYSLTGLDHRGPEAQMLARDLAAKGYRAAIANTTVSGLFLETLADAGLRCISLVHELREILDDYKLHDHARVIARRAESIVFAAEPVASSFLEVSGASREKAVIRPQGLYKKNAYRTQKHRARTELRSSLGLPEHARIVLGVGYIDHRKGVDLFVDAGIQVIESMTDTWFVWVGHAESTMQALIESRLDNHASADNFMFVGRKDDTDKYFAGADVFVLSSREDPFPSTVLESLEVAVPVVAFKGAGGAETLLSRGCGEMVPLADTDALAAAVESLLNNPDRARELGEAGASIVQGEFSFRHYVYDLLDLVGLPVKRVSAIVPNYNYARHLEQRLKSIYAQSYPIFEIIVLDDASTDTSVDVIEACFQATDIDCRLVRNSANSGSVFRQWQKGLREARGEFVWICEADDWAEPEFLQEAMRAFEDDDVVLSYTQSRQVDERGKVIDDSYVTYTADISTAKWTRDYVNDGAEELAHVLSVKNSIPNVSAVVFRKSALDDILPRCIDDMLKLKVAGDWLAYSELLRQGRIGYVSKALNNHRRHDSSVTLDSANNERHMAEILYMHDRISRAVAVPEGARAKATIFAKHAFTHLELGRDDDDPSKHPRVSQWLAELAGVSSSLINVDASNEADIETSIDKKRHRSGAEK